ncbi:MAG: hypothetical protein OEZ06_14745 [Myxococcales bacterium]|nr:hypothetical protein [Myxococcales bacterium]
MAEGIDEGGRGAMADRPNLSNEMQSVTAMIRDLEDQLDRMLESNGALKEDLESERKRRVGLERSVAELEQTIRRNEQEIAAKDNLMAEVGHLNNERSQLMARVRELEVQLTEAERSIQNSGGLEKRLRAAREQAIEEVQSVEGQFERAMRMVTQLRAQVAVLAEERDAFGGRLRVAEESLHQLQAERDALSSEVEQSRGALDEIRRSLADAVVASSESVDSVDGGGGRLGGGL